MSKQSHSHLVSSMLTDIRECCRALRRSLVVSAVLLLLAIVFLFAPWTGPDAASAAPAFVFFAFLSELLDLVCIVVIDRRIGAVQRIREEDRSPRTEDGPAEDRRQRNTSIHTINS